MVSRAASSAWPCLRNVARYPRRDANASAPASLRKQPETFCWTLSPRRLRSAWLLSNGMLSSSRKARTCSWPRVSRSRRLRAGDWARRLRWPGRRRACGGGLAASPAASTSRTLKARWQVWNGGYRSGRSTHWAPSAESTRSHRGPPGCCATVARARRLAGHLAEEGFEYLPLVVREVHRCCILLLDAAYHPFVR